MLTADLDTLIASAKIVIRSERSKYDPVLRTVIAHVADNKMQMSSPAWLLDPKMPPISEPITIWSTQALRDATALTNIIYKTHTPVVYLKTLVAYEEFEIWILGRRMFTVLRYPQIKGINTAGLFTSTEVETKEFGKLRFLDPEIELIELYHKLYVPVPDMWARVAQLEEGLFNQLRLRYPDVCGGAAKPDSQIRNLREHLFASLKDVDLGILIGHWALYHLHGTDPRGEKLQLLTALDPQSFTKKVNNLLRDATHMKVHYKTEPVHVPGDYWLARTTYYMHLDSTRKIGLLDTFNSLSYEMVPFHLIGGVRVGNAYVICRFLLVDKWMLAILEAMGLLSKEVVGKKMLSLLSGITAARLMDKYKFMDQYDGIWRDPVIEKRKLVKQQNVKFSAYTPAMYEKQYGKLRQL